MRDSVLRKLNELKALYRRRRVMMSVLSVLVCGVLLGTSYLLIQPAVTMTSETHCGQAEHVHSAECYDRELICPLAEHVHGEGCYDEDGVLVCAQEEHTHGEECYESTLTCTVAEHAHTLACYSDPTAVETEDDIAAYLDGLEPSGDWGADTAAVAGAMVGYAESEANYEVLDDGVTVRGYTFFGDCAGTPYADWNTLFADFCLDMAEVGEDVFPRGTDAAAWVENLMAEGYYTDDISDASVGDLAFMDADDDGAADRVGIVTAIDGEELTLAEGDIDNAVAEERYSASDILGYGMVTACWQCSDTMGQIDALYDEGSLLPGMEGADGDSSGGAVLQKQIKANEDGSYTLRLSAYVTGSTVVVQNYTPVDVVIIVDTSGSMNDNDATNKAGDTVTRITALKESVNDLISELAAHSSTTDPSRVSIVEFNYWRDLTWPDGNGHYYSGTTKAQLASLTSVLSSTSTETDRTVNSEVTTAVGNLTYHTATATEPWHAFELANDILYPADDAHAEHQKIVVFFTDGEPSPRVDGFGYLADNTYKVGSVTYTEQYNNHDQFTRYQNMNRTVEKAKILKDKGATIFSIGVFGSNMDVSTNGLVFRFLDAVSSDNTKTNTTSAVGSLLTLTNKTTTITGYGTTNGSASLGYPKFQNRTAPWGTTDETRSDIATSSYNWTAPSNTPYCMASNKASGITTGFQTVTDEILTLSAHLDEETILRDVLTLDFTTEGTNTAEIVEIYGVACTGFNDDGSPIWSTVKDTTYTQKCVCTIDKEYSTKDANGTTITTQAIDVKGFNYSEHWVGKNADGTVHEGGQKLVVEVKIHTTRETANSIAQDSNLPDSGIYDDGKKVDEFVVPNVELPTVMDIQVTGDPGYCDVELSKTATFHPPYDTSETGFTTSLKIDWSVTDQYKEVVGTDETAYYLGEQKALEVLTKDSTTEQRLYAPFPEPVSVKVSIPEGYTAIYTLDGETIEGTLQQDGRLEFLLDDGTRTEGSNGNYHLFKVTLVKEKISLTFTKKNEDGTALPSGGLTFTLTKEGAAEPSYTAKTSAKGVVTFSDIDWDHKRYDTQGAEDSSGSTKTTVYLLAETNSPSNYAPKYTYKLFIDDGELTVKTYDGATEVTTGQGIVWTVGGANVFYNEPILVNLTVKNIVEPSRTASFNFTVTVGSATKLNDAALESAAEAKKEFSKVFDNIPYGSTVKITETGYDGYSMVIKNGEQTVGSNGEYEFTITKDTTINFYNTAGYELPHTGGTGTILYTTIGGLLTSAALAGFMLRRRRERRAE